MEIGLWWHFCKYTHIEGPIIRPFALSNTVVFFFFFYLFLFSFFFSFLFTLVSGFDCIFFPIPFHWVSGLGFFLFFFFFLLLFFPFHIGFPSCIFFFLFSFHQIGKSMNQRGNYKHQTHTKETHMPTDYKHQTHSKITSTKPIYSQIGTKQSYGWWVGINVFLLHFHHWHYYVSLRPIKIKTNKNKNKEPNFSNRTIPTKNLYKFHR